MRIFYNVMGEKRKALISVISQELNQPIHYLGAPTFAYKVAGYQIDKTGTLVGEDNRGLIADLCTLHDFRAEQEEYDAPALEDEPVPDDIVIPYEVEVGGRVSPYSDWKEPPVYDQPELDRLVVEMPLDGFNDDALANLDKMVASKALLIRKALGADALPIEQAENKLRFPWFLPSSDGGALDAYARFIVALCAAAKAQKRVTAKEKLVENEKFAFRVFLIRLGMVGDDYKSARKILLRNLSGNSAFKSGRPVKGEVQEDE